MLTEPDEEDLDWNLSLFDLNIDSVDVTLSLWRWLDGKGLIEDAVVKGVRGSLGMSIAFCKYFDYSLTCDTQTDAGYTGTPKIPSIPPSSDTNHIPETLN